jgi:hypothetical protein
LGWTVRPPLHKFLFFCFSFQGSNRILKFRMLRSHVFFCDFCASVHPSFGRDVLACCRGSQGYRHCQRKFAPEFICTTTTNKSRRKPIFDLQCSMHCNSECIHLEYTRNTFGARLVQVINITTSRFTEGALVSTGKAKQTFGSPLQTMTLYSTGLSNLAKQCQMCSLLTGLIFVAHCLWKLVCRRPVCASP